MRIADLAEQGGLVERGADILGLKGGATPTGKLFLGRGFRLLLGGRENRPRGRSDELQTLRSFLFFSASCCSVAASVSRILGISAPAVGSSKRRVFKAAN